MSRDGCVECLRIDGSWVHLRLCLSCGFVGCCDASPGRHARQHAESAHHPLAQSFEPGEEWVWCYPDGQFVEPALVRQALAQAGASAAERPHEQG